MRKLCEQATKENEVHKGQSIESQSKKIREDSEPVLSQ